MSGDDAVLTRASIMFHTNDDDKDAESRLEVAVVLIDKSPVASISAKFQPGRRCSAVAIRVR